MAFTKRNILVTGACGQLGNELRLILKSDNSINLFLTDIVDRNNLSFIHNNYYQLDITNIQLVKAFVAEHKIDVLINCAAYTNVDKAETDYETADLINNRAVENLALACVDNNILMIHISTDYVFGGDEQRNIPYKEDDLVNPLGVYGKTKLAGEESIKRILNDFIIIRTAWLYSTFGNNFVKTMLRLTSEREKISVVADQMGTPTYAKDLADVIYKIIKNEQEQPCKKIGGIYNFTDEGFCSWYDFAKEIALLSNSKCVISPCTSLEYGSKVKRPKYSVLNKEKIKESLSIEIPNWKDSLKIMINKMQYE